MKKTLFALTTVGVTSLLAATIQTNDMPNKELIKQNKEIVKLASQELTKSLPQKVDEYTSLMKVDGKDNTLIYIFEINTGAKSDDAVRKEDRSRMESAVTYGVCKRNKRFLIAEINIDYLYNSAKSKAELFRFKITKEKCEELKVWQ